MTPTDSKDSKKKTLKIEEIAETLLQSMKKGNISTLILLALGKEPSHGYNLMQTIREKTYGIWNPTASSLYPHLTSLTEKKLIKFTIKRHGKRERKEYEITEKGTKALKLLLEKQRTMNNAFLSMVVSTIGLSDSSINNFQGLFDSDWIDDMILDGIKNKDEFKLLSQKKEVISFLINKLENHVNDIDKKIVSTKGKRNLSWL